MEQTRAKIIAKLNELNQFIPFTYSARELRGVKPMLQRVQRMEKIRYEEKIRKEKTKLMEEVRQIDRYLQSVRAYEDYLARRAAYEGSLFTEIAPILLPKPKILIRKKPSLVKTKLPRYTKRRRYR